MQRFNHPISLNAEQEIVFQDARQRSGASITQIVLEGAKIVASPTWKKPLSKAKAKAEAKAEEKRLKKKSLDIGTEEV